MSDEQQPGMSEEFKARMRQGLSSMAVRERVRERRRNRGIAGGAVAAMAAAIVGVGVWQFAGALDPRVDQAAPAPTTTPASIEPSAEPTPEPTPTATATATPEPTETGPTPPPGFEGIAAGEPIITDFFDCGGGCGDAGAGGGLEVERSFDVYVLCEGSGSVLYGGVEWIDCAQHEPGSGWALLGLLDFVGDGDPQYTTGAGFDGYLQVVDPGVVPTGSVENSTATVYYDCGPPVTIGGVRFACDGDPGIIPDFAAWGIAIERGSFAPRVEAAEGTRPSHVRWVMER